MPTRTTRMMATRIGITGHTNLTESTSELVYTALLAALESHAHGDLIGITCLARGADQLFAQAVLDLGKRIEVVLPASDYAERIPDPESKARFDNFVSKASAVRTMPFATSGPEAYMAASRQLIQHSDLLLAVWDGESAAGKGGTADVVLYARRVGCEMTIIWPPGARRA